MTAALDHLIVIAHSLEAGADHVEAAIGFRPGPGRKHPHMATHNLLLSLGPSTYLEVMAIDPDAPAVHRPRWFGLDGIGRDSAPRLAAWVANTDSIHAAACPDLGVVERMEREGLSWEMTTTSDGAAPLAGCAPVLIQRSTTVHPASRLPDQGLRLTRLLVRHPSPDQVDRLLARVGLSGAEGIVLELARLPALVAEIETPRGRRTLGGA